MVLNLQEINMIQLYDYKFEPTIHNGKPKFDKVLEYRFMYQSNNYLVKVEIDYQNVPLIYLYELDDITIKYVGDSGKNLFLLFNRMAITEKELIEHCNEWLMGVADSIFKEEMMEMMYEKFITNTYLDIFKYYQQLQLEIEEIIKIEEGTKEYIRVVENYHGKAILPVSKEVEELKERVSNFIESRKVKQCWRWDLGSYLNAGNLRHVVYTLFTEEGLSAKQFADKIGVTEEEIKMLIRDGKVEHRLLDKICKYFGIRKSPDFTRYINE